MNQDNPPRWRKLTLRISREEVEAVESALWEAGAQAVTLLDAEDHAILEPAPGTMPLWPTVCLEGLFGLEVTPEVLRIHLASCGVEDLIGRLQLSTLVDQDWERAWMDDFQPMRFGHGLWICPSHITPDPAWPLVLRLDPGLAFGSGTHPTTALCLEWLDGAEVQGRDVLDFGCGSGVLAVAAGLKGARRLVAVDHDPQALLATQDNAGRNGLEDRVETLLPAEFEILFRNGERFEIVLANILAAPLIELAPRLMASLQPGGHLVLSGILSDQAAAVARAYEALDPQPQLSTQDEWVRLVFSAPRAGG